MKLVFLLKKNFFDYQEASAFNGDIKFQPENAHAIYITTPKVEKKETIHLILKVTDKGTPALSRYKRIVVTVLPK